MTGMTKKNSVIAIFLRPAAHPAPTLGFADRSDGKKSGRKKNSANAAGKWYNN